MERDQYFQITEQITKAYTELNKCWQGFFTNQHFLKQLLLLRTTERFSKEIQDLFSKMKGEHLQALKHYHRDNMGVILTDLKEAIEINQGLYNKKMEAFRSIKFDKAEGWRDIGSLPGEIHQLKKFIDSPNYNSNLSLSENLKDLEIAVVPKKGMEAGVYELFLFDSVHDINEEILQYLQRYYPEEGRRAERKKMRTVEKRWVNQS
jgi:hypothetical protein